MHPNIEVKTRSLTIDYKIVQVGPEDPRKGKNDQVVRAYETHQTHLTPASVRRWIKQLEDYANSKTANVLEVSIHDATEELVFTDEFKGVLTAPYKNENLPKHVDAQYIVFEIPFNELLDGLEEAENKFTTQPKRAFFPNAQNISFQLA